MAIVAHELLTGVHPFGGALIGTITLGALDNPSAEPETITQTLASFFGRALSLDPSERPASARSFLMELEAAVGSGEATQ